MKNLFSKKLSILYIFLFVTTSSFSQQTDIDTNELTNYNRALKLYNNKAYAAAQHYFSTAKNITQNGLAFKADAAYYDAMCAIKLNQTNADKKILEFVKNHPNSNKKDKAYFNVANYYFANKKVAYSLKWYSKVNADVLSEENKKELHFKMGYALLVTKNFTIARKHFLPLINDPKYGNDARYYYGYIAYKQEDYGIAEKTLLEIADIESYKSEVTYFLLDISFKAGKYERCIEVGEKLLKKATKKDISEISKIIGESYFNLKKYQKAIPYLLAYKGKRGKWNNTDYYLLGYAYYKQKDYKNAITYFNRIIETKDNVSQNAYYHLAQCYLKLEQKSEALNAFKSASEMDFDKNIKEDASLNYAKLSYEEGNPYKSVALVLQDFLKTYPKSSHYNEVNQLVVTSYLHEKNYQGALDYLSKKKSQENAQLMKEVSLYKGIELYNKKDYKKALTYFEVAIKSNEKNIKNKAIYWKAETNFQLLNFQPAVDGFIAFKNSANTLTIDENNWIDYTIGYSYFKLKKYKKAIHFFQIFTNKKSENKAMNDDAMIRLGDCEFATKNYQKAIKAYQKIAKSYGVGADYAQYQTAMSYGFLGKNQQKTTVLTTIINDFDDSSFKDDALFQLGKTYTILKEIKKAHKAYEKLLKNHAKSSYVPNVLLREGLLYYNENQNEKALLKFKTIVTKYPNSNEAKQAVANARNVYIDDGNVDEYAAWVKNVPFINVTDADLDNTTFEAAENKFLENKTQKAMDGFTKYTKNFPNGLHALKANFYLAQLLSKENQQEKATKYYQYVVDQNQNEFSEEALNKLSQIYLEKEKWAAAIPLLERLEVEANLPQNITYAQSNLMKGYYKMKQYKKAVTYAEKVLMKDFVEESIEYDAKIIIARAAFKNEDFDTAEEYYREVERKATGELKAEALYYSAFFTNQHKEYKTSNKTIQNLAANYSAYKYWGLKGLILMAKNYYGLKDAYQATYILENVIEKATEFEDIVTDAKTELKKIKNNEAKTNNSVTPQN